MKTKLLPQGQGMKTDVSHNGKDCHSVQGDFLGVNSQKEIKLQIWDSAGQMKFKTIV